MAGAFQHAVSYKINVTGTQELNAATKSVANFTTTVDQSAKTVAGSKEKMSKGTQGLIAFGYALDDIQYGVQGVVNNLPAMAAAIGMSAAGGAKLAIAAIAVNILYNSLGNIANVLQRINMTIGGPRGIGGFNFKDWMPATQENVDMLAAIAKNIEKGRVELEQMKKATFGKEAAQQIKALSQSFEELGGTEKWIKMYEDGLKSMGFATKQAELVTRDLFKKIFTGDKAAIQELRDKYNKDFKLLLRDVEANFELLAKIERDAGKFPGEGGARARTLAPWRRQAQDIGATSSIDERIQQAMLQAMALGSTPTTIDRRGRERVDLRAQQMQAAGFIGQIDPRTGRMIRTPGQAADLQKFFGMEKRVDDQLIKETRSELIRRGVEAGEAGRLARVMVGDTRKETDIALADDTNRELKELNVNMVDLIGEMKRAKSFFSIRRRGR